MADLIAAAVECVGRQGMVGEPVFRFGVFVLREQAHYPVHWYGAQGLCLVVAGQAEFTMEGAEPVTLGPGGYLESEAPMTSTSRRCGGRGR